MTDPRKVGIEDIAICGFVAGKSLLLQSVNMLLVLLDRTHFSVQYPEVTPDEGPHIPHCVDFIALRISDKSC